MPTRRSAVDRSRGPLRKAVLNETILSSFLYRKLRTTSPILLNVFMQVQLSPSQLPGLFPETGNVVAQ